MAPRVSFVVLNWGQADATAMCVESVKAQVANAEIEVIVVDNESTLASRSRLGAIPGIVLLPQSNNRGFTGGMNAGFAIATGDYVAAVNNDLVLGPSWLATGLAQLAEQNVGIVGGTEFLWDDANPRGCTSNVSYTLCLVDAQDGYAYRTDEPMTTRDVYALDGNNLLMSRELLDQLGGFDDDFFAYYEDVDLCARALALGYRIRFCPDMRVWHRRNLSSNSIPYRRRFLADRNHLIFVARHFPEVSWPRTVRKLSWQYLLFGIIGHTAGVRGWRNAPPLEGSVRRAHLVSGLWGLSHWPYLKAKRRQAAASGQRSDSYVSRLQSR